MALIVGFPDIAASPKPSDADLNSACDKIVEQVGGIASDGTVHPGNLGLDNHVADVGFRNSQKKEPFGIFPISVRLLATEARTNGAVDAPWVARVIGPLPFDLTIVGASIANDGADVMDKAGLLIKRNGAAFSTIAASAEREWDLSLDVLAGDVLLVEANGITYASGGPASEIRATLWCKAAHRR